MVLIGSLSSLERHRSSTKRVSSHELIFWNILDMSDQRYFFECQFSLEKKGVLKKGVLKNFVNFLGKHLYRSLFFTIQVVTCEFSDIFKD